MSWKRKSNFDNFYLQMYYQCIHQRLYHLTPAEYEDFTGIILHARKVPRVLIFLVSFLLPGVHVDTERAK